MLVRGAVAGRWGDVGVGTRFGSPQRDRPEPRPEREEEKRDLRSANEGQSWSFFCGTDVTLKK